MINYFGTEQVAEVTGIHIKRLNDWLFHKIIPLPVMEGHKYYWTIADIYALALFKRIVEDGCLRNIASLFANAFHDDVGNVDKEDIKYVLFIAAKGKSLTVRIGTELCIRLLIRDVDDDVTSIHIYNIKEMITVVDTKLKEII